MGKIIYIKKSISQRVSREIEGIQWSRCARKGYRVHDRVWWQEAWIEKILTVNIPEVKKRRLLKKCIASIL